MHVLKPIVVQHNHILSYGKEIRSIKITVKKKTLNLHDHLATKLASKLMATIAYKNYF